MACCRCSSPDIALHAVNAKSREALFVLRYKRKHEPELEPYVRGLVGLAAHFVPTVPEAAARIGLLRGERKAKRGFRWFRRSS